jgi:hypothetical protein
MPKNKGKQRSVGKNNRYKNQDTEFPMSKMIYTGPVVQKNTVGGDKMNTVILIQDGAISSSGTGVINNAFNFQNPSSATDWSTASGLYDEYRVLAMDFSYYPNATSALPTVELALGYAPVYAVIDHDTNANLTSYGQAANYESLKVFDLVKKFRMTMKMTGLNIQGGGSGGNNVSTEGGFMNTSLPPVLTGAIKLFGTGFSNASVYGRFIIRYRVQFRGHAL